MRVHVRRKIKKITLGDHLGYEHEFIISLGHHFIDLPLIIAEKYRLWKT